MGLARDRQGQAQDHAYAERGRPASAWADGAPDLRCLGARLLPRLPEPAARFRAGVPRPSGELGLRRPEPGEGQPELSAPGVSGTTTPRKFPPSRTCQGPRAPSLASRPETWIAGTTPARDQLVS